MSKKILRACVTCGELVGTSRYYCSKCSPYGKKVGEMPRENTSFLLINEISEGNFGMRLCEGFKLLSND